MAESSDTVHENGETVQAELASAGAAQRVPAQQARAAAAAPDAAPVAAELDARQQAIGTTRRSGPPLVDTATRGGVAADTPTEEQEPTEVDEP